MHLQNHTYIPTSWFSKETTHINTSTSITRINQKWTEASEKDLNFLPEREKIRRKYHFNFFKGERETHRIYIFFKANIYKHQYEHFTRTKKAFG